MSAAPRFPLPPWLRDPPHRTMAEVRETEYLRAKMKGGGDWQRMKQEIDAQRLADLEARAVEPEVTPR